MGTWDSGPFDNDRAADWCGDLDDAAPGDRVARLRRALTGEEELEDGTVAVAAAAIVAAHQPGADPVVTPYAPDFLLAGGRLDLPADVVPLALRALDQVTAPESELRELWAEAGELPGWLASVETLRARLRGEPD